MQIIHRHPKEPPERRARLLARLCRTCAELVRSDTPDK